MNDLFKILYGGYYNQGYYDQGYYNQGYNNQGYNKKEGKSSKLMSFISLCFCIFLIMGLVTSIAYYYRSSIFVVTEEEKVKVKDDTEKDTLAAILARLAARPPPPPPPPPLLWENNDPKLWILEDDGNIIEIKKKKDFDINEPYYEMIINKNLNNTNSETILFNEISMSGKGYAWGISKDDKLYNCLKPCGSPIIKTIINPNSNKDNFDNEDLQLSEEECKEYSEENNYNYKKDSFPNQPSCFIERYSESTPSPGETGDGVESEEPKDERDTVFFNSIYPTKDENYDTDNKCNNYKCLQKKIEYPPSGNSIYEWKQVNGPHNRKGFKNITCDENMVYLRDENNIVWSTFLDGTKTWLKMPGDYPKYISVSNPKQIAAIKSDDKYMYCNKPCSGSTPWTESNNINYIKVHGSRNGIYAMAKETGGGVGINRIHYKDTDDSQWQILKDNVTGENLNCKDITSSKGTFFCLTHTNRIKYCKEPYDGNFKYIDTIGSNIKQITASGNGWPIKLKEKIKFSGNKIKDTTAYSELKSAINECDKLKDCVGINQIKGKHYLMPFTKVLPSANNFDYKIVESGTPDKSLEKLQCKIYGEIQNSQDITVINNNNAPFGCLQKDDIYYYNEAETLVDPTRQTSSTGTTTAIRNVAKDPKKDATVDVQYTYTATTGDDITLIGTTIPSWLTFSPDDGILYGTPTNSDIGSHDVVITEKKENGSSDDAFTIKVSVEDDDEPEVEVTPQELDPDRDKECGYDNWKCIEKDPYIVSVLKKPDSPICTSLPCYQDNKWTKDYEIVSSSIGEIYNNSYNAIKSCENNEKCMGINFYQYGKNFDNNPEYYLKEYNYPCCKKNEEVEQCSLNNSTSDRRNATTQEECENENGEWFPENVIKKRNTRTFMWIKDLNEIDQERKKNEIPEVITEDTQETQ